VVRDDGVLGVSVHCGNILGNGMRTGGDSRGGLHVNVGSCVIGTIEGSAFGGEFPALLNLQGTPLGGPNNNNDCQADTTNTTFLRIAPTPSSELTVGTAATSRCGRD
jgi:hypothetical protein